VPAQYTHSTRGCRAANNNNSNVDKEAGEKFNEVICLEAMYTSRYGATTLWLEVEGVCGEDRSTRLKYLANAEALFIG